METKKGDKDMIPEAKEIQRAYVRDWRRRNPHKVKKYNKTYWEKKSIMISDHKNSNSDKSANEASK